MADSFSNDKANFWEKELERQINLLEKGQSVAIVPPTLPVQWQDPPQDGTWVGVCSSGSTGIPKLIWRKWTQMKNEISYKTEVQSWTWATPFAPWTFAGLQVAAQAILTGGRFVFLQGPWSTIWKDLQTKQVDAISSTPTFIDLLIQTAPEGYQWSPKHITLGGEPLRPAVGNRIINRWPKLSLKVIYAAAEFGIIATSKRADGLYLISNLEKRWPCWRVEDGVLELLVDGQWKSTKDRIEIVGEYFRVIGRADRVANVGGQKVNLDLVTYVAENVAGIRRAWAYAVPNQITGEIVALRYELEDGIDRSTVLRNLEETLRIQLPKHAWPRILEEGPIQLGPNAKRAFTNEGLGITKSN